MFARCILRTGLKDEARWYLSKFSWGHSFLTLNETLLDKYAACADGAAVLEAQNEYIKQAEEERNERRSKNEYLDFSSSSESSNEDDDETNTDINNGAIIEPNAAAKVKDNSDDAPAAEAPSTTKPDAEQVDVAEKK